MLISITFITKRFTPQYILILTLVFLWSENSYAFDIWPSGTSGWDNLPATFCLDDNHGTDDIAGDGEWSAMINAFNTWETVPSSSISFTEAATCSRYGAGIDIYIGGWDAPFSNFWADNPSALAVALQYSPATPNLSYSEVWFNDAYNWNIGADYDVETVALHEIGHTFGLDHSDITGSIMYPYYGGIQTTLHQDDIAGSSFLYPTTPVAPEPISTALFLFGGATLAARRYWRKKKNA